MRRAIFHRESRDRATERHTPKNENLIQRLLLEKCLVLLVAWWSDAFCSPFRFAVEWMNVCADDLIWHTEPPKILRWYTIDDSNAKNFYLLVLFAWVNINCDFLHRKHQTTRNDRKTAVFFLSISKSTWNISHVNGKRLKQAKKLTCSSNASSKWHQLKT